jgi:antitoxin component YwqK of YwqJK toxin-antitoxin module
MKNIINDKGQRHGYWEVYYDNGQLYFKGDYVNGQRHGYSEEYHPNGKLEYKGNYVNGKKHGHWEFYYLSGLFNCERYYDMSKEVDYVVNLEPELTPEMFSIF